MTKFPRAVAATAAMLALPALSATATAVENTTPGCITTAEFDAIKVLRHKPSRVFSIVGSKGSLIAAEGSARTYQFTGCAEEPDSRVTFKYVKSRDAKVVVKKEQLDEPVDPVDAKAACSEALRWDGTPGTTTGSHPGMSIHEALVLSAPSNSGMRLADIENLVGAKVNRTEVYANEFGSWVFETEDRTGTVYSQQVPFGQASVAMDSRTGLATDEVSWRQTPVEAEYRGEVTQAEWDSLRDGMTRDEVEAHLGAAGSETGLTSDWVSDDSAAKFVLTVYYDTNIDTDTENYDPRRIDARYISPDCGQTWVLDGHYSWAGHGG